MRDATEVERRGTPAIAVITRPFRITAASMAVRQGYPDYPFVLIDHPLSSLDHDEVRRRAAGAVGQVAALLGAP
jgi:hypothetical protein